MSFQISPFRDAVAVTPSDATVIPFTRGVYVGGTGNIAVRMNGTTSLFSGVPAGTTLYITVDQILATNTTATLINALY